MKQRIAFAFIMGIITTGIISFTLILLNFGFKAAFFAIWFRSWSVSYLIAVMVILFLGPSVQVFTSYLLKKTAAQNRKVRHHYSVHNHRK